jgi:hypothetical protein
MNEERSGLVLSILATGKRFNRIESINNGRIILFADVLGAILPMEGWVLNEQNRFRFSLITREDELVMDMEAPGVSWLQAVRDMAVFMKIPKPSARSMSVAPSRAVNTTMNSLIEFSANSGAVFACSSDIPLLLEGFNQVAYKSAVILEIAARMNWILKLIPELKSNKEAALIFGERLEEVIRALGDPEVGIVFQSRDSDKSLLNFHLSTLHGKLQDIVNYLTVQSRSGWLIASLTNTSSLYGNVNSDSAKVKYDLFDSEITSIVNALIKATSSYCTSLTPFEKKEYIMAVDVRKSIDALGGIEAIYHDAAKERALARLIQCDAQAIHMELIEFIRMTQEEADSRQERNSRSSFAFLGSKRSSSTNQRTSSFASYHSSQDYSVNQKNTSPPSSWISRYCCCCFRRSKLDNKSPTRKSHIQLEEPLVQ